MKAVNLIPDDARASSPGRARGPLGPSHAVVGLLLVAVAFVLARVLVDNAVSDRTATLASLHAQVSQEQAAAARLTRYVRFEQQAQQREQTIRTIAAARFDWKRSLDELSQRIPSNTSLSTLSATVAQGGTAATTAAASASLTGPTFTLSGCTATQNDVATLLRRLRAINDAVRVSLTSSTKGSSAIVGTTSGSGCRAGGPTFNLTIYFKPVPGASAAGYTPSSTASGATTTATTSSATSTPAAITTAGTTTTAVARVANATTPGGQG